MSDSQVVLVTGEEDNEYLPNYDEMAVPVHRWRGFAVQGTLHDRAPYRFVTPVLPKGVYVFAASGEGDLDLYLRIGAEPTIDLFDCRPYKSGGEEVCEVRLPAPAPLYGMIQSESDLSFTLQAKVYSEP